MSPCGLVGSVPLSTAFRPLTPVAPPAERADVVAASAERLAADGRESRSIGADRLALAGGAGGASAREHGQRHDVVPGGPGRLVAAAAGRDARDWVDGTAERAGRAGNSRWRSRLRPGR